jgi:hypothetical protein
MPKAIRLPFHLPGDVAGIQEFIQRWRSAASLSIGKNIGWDSCNQMRTGLRKRRLKQSRLNQTLDTSVHWHPFGGQ